MSDIGAAFGFFPQMKPRRQGLPSDSANLPIDVLRGRLAGLLGAPADIANLLRSPSPTEMFGDVSYEAPAQFPYTTEKFLKDLPLAPTSRVGQVVGQAASFVPLNPMPAVRGVQKVGQVVGEELAATMLGQRPNSMMSKVVPQPLFAVAPEQGLLATKTEPIESLLQTKPQAPVSDIGFYSATEQAALNLGRNKGTGQSFINDLMKAPDVKKEELQFTGLDEFLRDKPNVTKQEVQDFLANNRVDVQEVTLGGNTAPSQDLLSWMNSRSIMTPRNPEGWQELSEKLERYAQQHQKAQGAPETSQRYFTLSEEAGRISEGLDAGGSAAGATKYDKYTLAGGENYREILLTLPEAMPNTALEIERFTRRMETMRELQNEFANAGNMEKAISFASKADDLQAYIKQLEKIPVTRQTENFESSHFDQPNILAHMRVNDRIDADGKKMLLVEEIQSDWHQAGREKGYKSKESLEKWYNQNKLDDDPSFADLNSEQRSVIERNRSAGMGGDNAVPDAPFKDTWYQLALKRLTKYAAENGYDRIGLTTGRQQADRFNLAESFDAMNYKKNKDGTYAIAVKPKGEGIFQSDFGGTTLSSIPEKELPSIVGKELAQKIISGEGRQAASRKVLEGIDLQVGGEGMKKYYDEIYPKFLDKYGKKYGASVGETSINTGKVQSKDELAAQIYGRGEIYRNLPSEQKRKIDVMFMDMAKDEPIRYLDITPQMKEGTSKGQPLFAATPLLPATSLLDEEKRKEITSLLE
jgi:hypothetical protein